jgi:hypothetical protein
LEDVIDDSVGGEEFLLLGFLRRLGQRVFAAIVGEQLGQGAEAVGRLFRLDGFEVRPIEVQLREDHFRVEGPEFLRRTSRRLKTEQPNERE